MKRSASISLFIILMLSMSGTVEVSQSLVFPVPDVSASVSSVQLNVNSRYPVRFEVANIGGSSSSDSYLSISISHGLDVVSWYSTPSLPDLLSNVYEVGDLIWNNQYEQIPADYVLLDVYGHPFESGESVTITAVVQSRSPQSSNEWIKYRVAMLPAGVNYPTDVSTARDPTSSPEIDQQGYPVYTIDVRVSARASILFDEMRAGADTLDNQYSEVAQTLSSQGYIADRTDAPLSYASLTEYDVLVITCPFGSYSNAELMAVDDFVELGGGILLMGQWRIEDETGLSQVADLFQIDFLGPGPLRDPDLGLDTEHPIFTSFVDAHPVLFGVDNFMIHGGRGLSLGSNAIALAWGDENTFADLNDNGRFDVGEPIGEEAISLAALVHNEGRGIFLSDTDIFDNDSIHTRDHKRLFLNVIDWLAHRFWWDDKDGDGRENYLDLEGITQSLVDHGFDEKLVTTSSATYSVWKWDVELKVHLIWPETEEDVDALSEWVKEQTSYDDYDFVISDLQDHHIPFMAIVEVPKSYLTKLWPIGFAFELLPADKTNNIVRWILTIGYSDLDTLANILIAYQNSPMNILPKLAYSFPCITDGEGKTSHITGEPLWFRFTRPYEFSRENVGKFALGLLVSLLGLIPGSTAAQVAYHIGSFFFSFIQDYVYEKLLELEQLEETLLQKIVNLLLVKLEDLQGDVDAALFIDDNFVLGSFQEDTISTSQYGEYIGDFSTELLFINQDRVADHNAKIVLSAEDVIKPENITLSWMSLDETNLLASGVFNETIVEAYIHNYQIEIKEGIATVTRANEEGLELWWVLPVAFVIIAIMGASWFAVKRRARARKLGRTIL